MKSANVFAELTLSKEDCWKLVALQSSNEIIRYDLRIKYTCRYNKAIYLQRLLIIF